MYSRRCHLLIDFLVLRIAHGVHVRTSYFCLIPLVGTVSFPVSARPNRVQVRPLLHVTVELTMKQTSNTRNTPKYIFAGSLKIPTKSDVPVVHNDLRTWRSNRKKKHIKNGGRSRWKHNHEFRANSRPFRKNEDFSWFFITGK